MNIIWKPVIFWLDGIKIDFTGTYEISNCGEVRTVDRYVQHNYGGKAFKKGRVKTQHLNSRGYKEVGLYKGKRTQYRVQIQRLVWQAFYGQIPEGMQVNHINEVKTDNHLENLNLLSPKENSNWGTRNQRISKSKEKPIVQYDLEGNYVKKWNSTSEVVKYTKENGPRVFTYQSIQKNLHSKTKTAYGFVWKYA